MRRGVARLRYEAQRERERGDPNGKVDEEDPRPREVLGQHPAEDEADGRTADGDGCPDAERLGALRALGECRRDDRQRGRGDQRRTKPLQCPRADQHPLTGGEPVEQRGAREDHQADQEQALAAEEVTGAPSEEQESAEHERVGVDDPLQVALGQVQILLDRGKRDVHDRCVEHDHELRQADQDEDDPGVGCVLSHRQISLSSGLISPFEPSKNRTA